MQEYGRKGEIKMPCRHAHAHAHTHIRIFTAVSTDSAGSVIMIRTVGEREEGEMVAITLTTSAIVCMHVLTLSAHTE